MIYQRNKQRILAPDAEMSGVSGIMQRISYLAASHDKRFPHTSASVDREGTQKAFEKMVRDANRNSYPKRMDAQKEKQRKQRELKSATVVKWWDYVTVTKQCLSYINYRLLTDGVKLSSSRSQNEQSAAELLVHNDPIRYADYLEAYRAFSKVFSREKMMEVSDALKKLRKGYVSAAQRQAKKAGVPFEVIQKIYDRE
jgi:hypothetical protein